MPRNRDVPQEQTGMTLDELGFFPPTVHDHSPQPDGATLHTIDPEPDSDIEVYDGDRPAHRAGNPPE